jgi:hypothetical protein
MLRRVALVRTDVSEEHIASIIRVTKIDELGILALLATDGRCEETLSSTKHLVFLRSVRRLLVMANVFPSSPILVALMMEALGSSETLVLTSATPRNIQKTVFFSSN